ncbi:hypothetical protein HII31_00548 [Pseudocercospora fuligena]|uniref:Uncharacterized protein n=1 Tax=Pseudocercospora fuligena TaxID=685502 RepID=A0A8H6VPW4_9PEZI|nr:hypothetical protein HII31_00548 [Pseudocercospora fuligena]
MMAHDMEPDEQISTQMATSVITNAVSDLHITPAKQSPPAMEASTAESCPFLEKIPAELRNDIYQLAFTPDHDSEKKIYDEAREYYIEAYRDYWQNTEFSISCKIPPSPFTTEINEYGKEIEILDYHDLKATKEVERVAFRARDVDHIRHITLYREVLRNEEGERGFLCFKFGGGLPAELRNVIYELTFTADHDTEDQNGTAEIELLKSRPPSKDLLLACRKVHAEAKGIYRDAYRSYWQTTNFVINIGQRKDPRLALTRLDKASVDHITKLRVDYRYMPDRVHSRIATKHNEQWCWRVEVHILPFPATHMGYVDLLSNARILGECEPITHKQVWSQSPLSEQVLDILEWFAFYKNPPYGLSGDKEIAAYEAWLGQ